MSGSGDKREQKPYRPPPYEKPYGPPEHPKDRPTASKEVRTMSHIPPHGPPPPHYYGYPVPTAPAPGAYTYVPAPVMMPIYPPPHHMLPPHHMPAHHPPPHHPPPHHPPPPPEPQPQPTYVTNYIYQQPPPPEPVRVVEENPSTISVPRPWQAIAGIAETCLQEVNKHFGNNTQDIHVLSSDINVDWVPSTASSANSLAHRAFAAGKEGWDGSPLWVIRAHHSGEFVPGKLSIKQRAASIPYAGREVPVHNFEVLCAPQHILRWLPASNGQVPVGAVAAGNTHNAESLYIARCKHQRSTTPGKVHPSHGCAYISFGGSEIPYKTYEVLCKIVG